MENTVFPDWQMQVRCYGNGRQILHEKADEEIYEKIIEKEFGELHQQIFSGENFGKDPVGKQPEKYKVYQEVQYEEAEENIDPDTFLPER